jgi:uncharacterized protein
VANFRKTCRWLHREFGFAVAGLTLIYAISGVAVNHTHQWNPSYKPTVTRFTIAPVGMGVTEEISAKVTSQLPLTEPVKSVWRSAPDQMRVIIENGTYDVGLLTGEVVATLLSPRPVLNEINFLHLNKAKGIWTWIADLYAVVLTALVITGLVLVKGAKGLAGRGGILAGLGLALPIVYLLIVK